MMLSSALKIIKNHVSKVGMVITVIVAALILFLAIREVKTAHISIGAQLDQFHAVERHNVHDFS